MKSRKIDLAKNNTHSYNKDRLKYKHTYEVNIRYIHDYTKDNIYMLAYIYINNNNHMHTVYTNNTLLIIQVKDNTSKILSLNILIKVKPYGLNKAMYVEHDMIFYYSVIHVRKYTCIVSIYRTTIRMLID